MSETVPAAPAELGPVSMERPPAKKRGKKQVGLARKAPSPSVSKLITEALSASHERAGMSLAALKKALAAAGYDVEKNNSRIKLGLKSLVSKGTLVQTKGTGASGSFKLSKKAAPEPAKRKGKKAASAKAKKLVLSRESKSPKSTKATKRARKPRTTTASKVDRAGRKAAGAKGKPPRQSPAKARAGKSAAGRAKLSKQRTNPRKTAPKK
ncbi:histone H1t [Pteropus alecto]|uniref:Histone H1t n=1 Tax=Pteropus alecto TaxID=9402 RepID=L5JUG6_PTEAL|nr:histone H1t [Pteropus alecto]ELK02692.1 Histone H1t [Pteropus alecto]